LEALIESSAQDIELQEKEVARLKGHIPLLSLRIRPDLHPDIAERTDSLSKAALDHKKQSRE
jgi:hypothetical protein